MADIIDQIRRRYLESMDWSPAFKSGITAIEALGRCLIVTSHPSAALIKLGEKDGYAGERLPVMLHDCAVMGMDTFMDTQMRMATISREATELMEPSGPIGKIVGYLQQPPSARVQRDIQRERKYLVETYNDFFDQLEAITEKWDQWSVSTSELTRIARGQTGYTAEATERTKLHMDLTNAQISQSQHQIKLLENQVNELKQKLTEARVRYTDKLAAENRVQKRWYASRKAAREIERQVRIMQDRYNAAKQEQLAQSERFLESQIEEFRLRSNLNGLASKREKLECIMKSLCDACNALQNVIINVRQFINFFEILVGQVKILDRDLERLGDVISDNEGASIDDESTDAGEIREETLQDAIRLRASFAIIRLISNIYGEVSTKHFMPGIQTVYQLGSTCVHDPELERERKNKDLISYSNAAHRDVEAICRQVMPPLPA
ncbi:hypothetical protein K440DRAFT_632612 [Wilcoxina mikolae CBS 423.85]|nr:hypothetical protein K440DRAFT_632612 [Wilcoxina mikolae CBS 423.85]